MHTERGRSTHAPCPQQHEDNAGVRSWGNSHYLESLGEVARHLHKTPRFKTNHFGGAKVTRRATRKRNSFHLEGPGLQLWATRSKSETGSRQKVVHKKRPCTVERGPLPFGTIATSAEIQDLPVLKRCQASLKRRACQRSPQVDRRFVLGVFNIHGQHR